ncbi:50S ribosomal protein L25 [Tepidiforma sp.]|uniref:50S ribosomal protein L25 n=1 Tax=Tepidiforma sp. TaxID=2682230 RepID=UPI002ADE394E|nr:50S ribosomal protein L25 [Tepidiforma sp.]
MAERVTIEAAPREVLGKKVKQLRRQGRLPANVYGKGLESRAIDIDAREFSRTVKQAGLRAMIELRVAGEADPRYVILRGISRAHGTGDPIHVDFFQVDPERPITANVPLRLVGEAPAVRDLAGTLLPGLEIVSVRCRPLDIPDTIPVDLAPLKDFSSVLTVGDIAPPPGVEILTDPSIVVATVNPPRIRGGRGG